MKLTIAASVLALLHLKARPTFSVSLRGGSIEDELPIVSVPTEDWPHSDHEASSERNEIVKRSSALLEESPLRLLDEEDTPTDDTGTGDETATDSGEDSNGDGDTDSEDEESDTDSGEDSDGDGLTDSEAEDTDSGEDGDGDGDTDSESVDTLSDSDEDWNGDGDTDSEEDLPNQAAVRKCGKMQKRHVKMKSNNKKNKLKKKKMANKIKKRCYRMLREEDFLKFLEEWN